MRFVPGPLACLLAATIIAGCGKGPPASGEGCPGESGFDRRSVIKISTPFAEPVLHYELDTAGIEAMRATPAGQARVPGLTVAQYGIKKGTRISGSQKPGRRRLCVWVDALELEFSYTKLDVYVSKDYPETGCERLHIHRHELEHVAVNRRLHQRYAGLMTEALAGAPKLPTRANPASVETREAGQKLIDDAVAAVTVPLYAAFEEELKAGQAALDTPESYQALKGMCQDWQ